MNDSKAELGYSFLFDIERFKEELNRVYKRTPNHLSASYVDFWLYFFLGPALSIQNSKFNATAGVEDVLFSIKRSGDMAILKLAYKIHKDDHTTIKLRCILISKTGNREQYQDLTGYSSNEIDYIEGKLGGEIDSATDSRLLVLDLDRNHNDEHSISLEINNNTPENNQNDQGKNFYQIRPLKVKGADELCYLDDTLDAVSNPEMIDIKKVESLFENIIDLYHNNQDSGLSSLEAAYHGFTYGLFVWNFKKAYGIDTYVERSGGRGFLDLSILPRAGNPPTNNALHIICELKADTTTAQEAIEQIEAKGYLYNLVGRTIAQEAIVVGMNFGQHTPEDRLVVKKLAVKQATSFISAIRDLDLDNAAIIDQYSIQLKEVLKPLFHSIRKEEPLGLLIIGDLLSTYGISNRQIFTADIEARIQRNNPDKLPPAYPIILFKNKYNKHIALNIIDLKGVEDNTLMPIAQDLSKPATRNNSHDLFSKIESSVNHLVNNILYNNHIEECVTINIVVDSTADYFEPIVPSKSYFLKNFTVKLVNINQEHISDSVPYNLHQTFNQPINLNELIPALRGLANDDSHNTELDRFKDSILQLKDLIHSESDFKALLHGLFLGKTSSDQTIQTITEISSGKGRSDIALLFSMHDAPIILELKYNSPIANDGVRQARDYIEGLKYLTNRRKANGVALNLNKNSHALTMQGFEETIQHLTTDEEGQRTSFSQLRSGIADPAIQNVRSPGSEILSSQSENEQTPIKAQSPDQPRAVLSPIKNPASQNIANRDENHPSGSKRKLDEPSQEQSPHKRRHTSPALHCLAGPSSITKRSINHCKISWKDVDRFNAEKVYPRDRYKIKIDSDSWVAYIKTTTDRGKVAQIIALTSAIIGTNSHNVVGNDQYLLSKIIEYNGYHTYMRNKLLHHIANNLPQQAFSTIKPQLKNKILHAAAKMQLAHAVYGTIHTCRAGNSPEACLFNAASLEYSFSVHTIERLLMKQTTPKFINKVSIQLGKVMPNIGGINTKLATKVIGFKHGTKMAKGTAGALGGLFDIIEIVAATKSLLACEERKNSDPCSDKMIRDHIVAISFSGVSFISSIPLAMGSGGPLGIAVGMGLMIGYGVYNGISSIIEYEAQYDTTHTENWSIFWRTVLGKEMAGDVEALMIRTAIINGVAQTISANLARLPDHIVGYAVPIGQEEIYKRVICQGKKWEPSPVVGQMGRDHSDCQTEIHISIVPGYSNIDPNPQNASSENGTALFTYPDSHLSRVLPQPIAHATFTCLPIATHKEYEKQDHSRSDYPDAQYTYCDNALIIQDTLRAKSHIKHKTMVFDLANMDRGRVIGSKLFHNVFFISKGKGNLIGGNDTSNHFIFTQEGFTGKVTFGQGHNNLIDFHKINGSIAMAFIKVKEGNGPAYMDTHAATNSSIVYQIFHENITHPNSLTYMGRPHQEDQVTCSSNQDHLIINSGGGLDPSYDVITNCSHVWVSPFTLIAGTNGTYQLTIITDGYETQNSSTVIDIAGNGTILFPTIHLLKESVDITYHHHNGRELVLAIGLTHNSLFTLSIKNYLNQDNQPNFRLIDQYNSTIIPKIDSHALDDTTARIRKFELQNSLDFDANRFNITLLDYIERLSYSNKTDYQVFTLLSSVASDGGLVIDYFGSSMSDVMVLQTNANINNRLHAGLLDHDLYVASHLPNQTAYIMNYALDRKLDALAIPQTIEEIASYKDKDDLVLTSPMQNRIILSDYFLDPAYQHITILDQNNNYYIPLQLPHSARLVPFYHYHPSKSHFVLKKHATFVMDGIQQDIRLYRDANALILHAYSHASKENISIQLTDFFSDRSGWTDLTFYTYHNGTIDYEQPIDLIRFVNARRVYPLRGDDKDIIATHRLNFDKYSAITAPMHNQKVTHGRYARIRADEAKIEKYIFRGMDPHHLTIAKNGMDLLFTHGVKSLQLVNFFADSSPPYIFEYNTPHSRLITIETYHDDIDRVKRKFEDAKALYQQIEELDTDMVANYITETKLKCILVLHALTIYTDELTDIYSLLDFDGWDDVIGFTSTCNLDQLKEESVIPNNVPSLLDKYKEVLRLSNIKLKLYPADTSQAYDQLMDTHFQTNQLIDTLQLFMDHNTTQALSTVSHKRSKRAAKDTRYDYAIIAAKNKSVTSSARKPTSWMSDLWQLGKKLISKVVDGYTKPETIDGSVEYLNHLSTIHTINRPFAPLEAINYFNAYSLPSKTATGPTVLELGDQWVNKPHINGLLMFFRYLFTKKKMKNVTNTRSHDIDIDKNGIDIPSSIQSGPLVDSFMDKVKEQADACGINSSDMLDNPAVYTQAIKIVSKQLAKGQIDNIWSILVKEIVEDKMPKIAAIATPDQANQFLANVRADFFNIEQQSSQASAAEERLAATTQKAAIQLLKQDMCSMAERDQTTDATLVQENTYNNHYITWPNNIDHDSPYRQCGSV